MVVGSLTFSTKTRLTLTYWPSNSFLTSSKISNSIISLLLEYNCSGVYLPTTLLAAAFIAGLNNSLI